MQQQATKKHLIGLFSVWIILWAIGIGFSIFLYKEGHRYPVERVGPGRLRDAMLAIYFITGVIVLFSVIWYFTWKSYRKNQQKFNSMLTNEDKENPYSFFDSSYPISLQENLMYINRGFKIDTVDITTILWIHKYKVNHRHGYSIMYILYHKNGKKTKIMLPHNYSSTFLTFIDKIKENNKNIMLSKGLWSAEFRKCKARYKERLYI